MKRALLLLAIMLPIEVGMAGSFTSGNELLTYCSMLEETKNEPSEHGKAIYVDAVCTGYVVGVADVLAGGDPVQGFRACIPEGVTKGQTRKIVAKFLRDNPNVLHYAASGVVAKALSEGFPCQR